MAINSLSSSSHGLSGLASGMDTQQMVEAMLSGTQTKIDATSQKKTQLSYKQGLYRDLTTKLLNFQNTFFKYGTSSTNLMSPSFFNSMTATSTSSAFKAIASSTASVGKTTVNYIKRLAQTERAKSAANVTGKLQGEFDATKMQALEDKMNQSIKFKTEGGAEMSVSIKDLVGGGTTPNGTLEIERILKEKLAGVADVSFEGGSLMLSTKDGTKMTVDGDANAMKMFGLTAERKSSDDGKLALAVNPTAALPTLDVSVNGVKKTIAFNPISAGGTGWTAGTFAARMQETLQKSFGTKVQVTEEPGGNIKFWMKNGSGAEDTTSQITLVGNVDNGGRALMDAFGIANGRSTKINTGMTLAEANFAEPVLGGMQKFTINGVDFSVNSGDSIYSVLDQINSSAAGVTVSYQATEDKFVIESKVSGELPAGAFTMSQTEGNLLTSMFGVGRSGSLSTGIMTGSGPVTGEEFTEADQTYTDQTVRLKFGNVYRDIQVSFKPEDTKDAKTFVERLNEAIQNDDAVTDNLKGKVSFDIEMTNGKGKLSMGAVSGTEVQVVSGLETVGMKAGTRTYTGVAKDTTSMTALGFKSNRLNYDGKPVDADGNVLTGDDIKGLHITIGGQTVYLEENDTVASFEAKLNTAVKDSVAAASGDASKAGAEFDKNTGRYRMFGVDIPMGPPPQSLEMQVKNDDGKLLGTNEVVAINKTAGSALDAVQAGQNAIVSINGVEIERSSNSFTLDGITYELINTTPLDASGNPTQVDETINVTRDTDTIYEGVTKFVEEYNKLVDAINEQLNGEATYRDYPPLTDKQRETMSDREVELWEEKSKGGLLRNDSTLEMAMNGLRGTLYTRPTGGMSLYELGIQPNSYYGERDHLTIEDPAKLKQRITENPNMVQALFTDTEEGLSQLLDKAITNAASTNPGSPGMLVREAGATGRVDTSSNIYREVDDLNKRLSSLKRTYEAQYGRYWKQFNSMEQMISQMNQQSGWLTQQFS